MCGWPVQTSPLKGLCR